MNEFFFCDFFCPRFNKVFADLISFIKDEGEYQRENLGAIIIEVKKVVYAIHEILHSCMRTTRKAVGSGVKEIVFPSNDELQRFYECERKVRYISLETVEKDLQVNKESYKCKHCGFFHQGSHPTGQVIPDEIMVGRWKTTWRRTKGV